MDHGSRHMEGRGRGAAHRRAAFVQRRALMRYGATNMYRYMYIVHVGHRTISEESPLRRQRDTVIRVCDTGHWSASLVSVELSPESCKVYLYYL